MPVVPCPSCNAELDLDDADVGHLVECPACLARFAAPPPDPTPPPSAAASAGRDRPATGESALPPAPPPTPGRGEPDPDTVVVKCGECRGDVSVLVADLGHLLQCPLCDRTFTARDPNRNPRPAPPGGPPRRGDDRDRDDRPSRRSRWARPADDDEHHADTPRAVVQRAQRQLTTPGGGLQVLGWIDVATGLLGILIGALFLATGLSRPQGPEWEMVWMNAGPGLSGIVIGGVKAFGGAAMKQAKNRTLAVLAAVTGCVPLNVSCCLSPLMLPLFVVSIVFGIMGLAVLFRADVRKAFEITRPGGDADAG